LYEEILRSISMLVKHNLSFLGQNSYFTEKFYFFITYEITLHFGFVVSE